MLLTINSLQLPLLNCVCVSLLDYTINRLLFVCFHYLFQGLYVLFCVSLCLFLLSLCGTTKKLDLSNSVTAHAHLLSVLLTICIYFSLNSCTLVLQFCISLVVLQKGGYLLLPAITINSYYKFYKFCSLLLSSVVTCVKSKRKKNLFL